MNRNKVVLKLVKKEIRKERLFWYNILNLCDLLERFSWFDDVGVVMVIL